MEAVSPIDIIIRQHYSDGLKKDAAEKRQTAVEV